MLKKIVFFGSLIFFIFTLGSFLFKKVKPGFASQERISIAVNTHSENYGEKSFDNERKVTFAFKYDDEKDFLIDIAPAGPNRLPNIGNYYTAENKLPVVSRDFSRSRTQLINVATDYIMPYQVYAINNPTNQRTSGQRIWTGGYHGAEGTNFNLPSSAKNVSYRIFADNAEITRDTGEAGIIAKKAVVEIVNNIAAFNTIDIAKGYDSTSSRPVLTEKHTLTLEQGTIEKHTEITALEEIKIFVHYGLGLMLTETGMDENTTIQYFKGASDDVFPAFASSTGTDSGTKRQGARCSLVQIKTAAGDVRELFIDTGYGIGNYSKIDPESQEAFMESTRKLYINLINKPSGYQYDDSSLVTLRKGDKLVYRGGWRFYKNK